MFRATASILLKLWYVICGWICVFLGIHGELHGPYLFWWNIGLVILTIYFILWLIDLMPHAS